MKPRLLLLLIVILLAFSAAAGPTRAELAILNRAKRIDQDGWVILHVEGEPTQRGFQLGFHLNREITWGLRVRKLEWEHASGMQWQDLVKKSNEIILPKVDPEYRQELEGMVGGLQAAGVQTTLNDLIAYNAYVELTRNWWPQERRKSGASMPALPPPQAASAFIATGGMTSDGGIVLGHNGAFPYTDYPNVILDIVPVNGHRILMQVFPGWIHSGTDFFITDAGLVGAETAIGGFHGYDPAGVPEFVRMRRATQYSNTLDEWVRAMNENNSGGAAAAWLIGDTRTNEIARLELGLENAVLQRTRNGWYGGSNLAESTQILRQETDGRDDDIRLSSVARRVRMNMLMRDNAGKINATRAKELLADHYDTLLGRDNPGARSLCVHQELEGPLYAGELAPFTPLGSMDGLVVDSSMAKKMTFAARWGSACGRPFDAQQFMNTHLQFNWMREFTPGREARPWITVKAVDMK
jgi:hypothetical protein